MKFNRSQKTIWAKGSSLAVELYKDNDTEFKIYVFNRRTRSIIAFYEIPLMHHCRRSMLDILPIKDKRPRKKK